MRGVRHVDGIQRLELARRQVLEDGVPHPDHVFLGQRDPVTTDRLIVDEGAVPRVHVGDENLVPLDREMHVVAADVGVIHVDVRITAAAHHKRVLAFEEVALALGNATDDDEHGRRGLGKLAIDLDALGLQVQVAGGVGVAGDLVHAIVFVLVRVAHPTYLLTSRPW